MFPDQPSEAEGDIGAKRGDPADELPEFSDDGGDSSTGRAIERSNTLDDLAEPLPSDAGARCLVVGDSVVDDTGQVFIVGELVTTEAGVHRYTCSDGDESLAGCLLEAFTEEARGRLRCQSCILGEVSSSLFPRRLGFSDGEDRTYLIVEEVRGPTLADAFARGAVPLPQLLGIIGQVAAGLAHLHERGWVHLAIRPSQIVLTKPVKLTDVSYAARIGEKPRSAFYFAGYSPPELLAGASVDARADIYTIGALLYHGVNGSPIAETGPALSIWEPPKPVAGIPQILHRCLGEPDSRFPDMHELHRAVLSLARRQFPLFAYSVGTATTLGLEPSRTVNQDAYVSVTGQLRGEDATSSWTVVGVADGMGGMAAGELASQTAVNTLLGQALSALPGNQAITAANQVALARQWVTDANARVCEALAAHRARGGTTLTCVWLVGNRLSVAHVGDCRLYRISSGSIELLTQDHSVAMARALQGEIALDAVRSDPDRSQVTRSLGDRQPLPEWYVDTLEVVRGQPTIELRDGDILLLATDGLWELVLEPEMLECIEQTGGLQTAAEALVQLVLERGGPDNATAVLVRLDEIPISDRHQDVCPSPSDTGTPEGNPTC